MTEPCKCKKCINGVRCEATNCVYNDENCTCHAEYIDVKSPDARKKDETFCSTFCAGHNCT